MRGSELEGHIVFYHYCTDHEKDFKPFSLNFLSALVTYFGLTIQLDILVSGLPNYEI